MLKIPADAQLRPHARVQNDGLFILAAITSAGLVFSVEPMMARLALPVLGGSAAVWNASLAFFQIALLVGYLYAHLLQRVTSLRGQLAVHLVVLALAALALPLGLTRALGDPAPAHPALWLLAALTLSVGPPFAALSATAPLTQAWFARTASAVEAARVWRLYAASNAGSLAALIAYPILVEPNLRLVTQRGLWSGAYVLFAALMSVLAARLWRRRDATPGHEVAAPAAAVSWIERLRWVALAAAPSSLLLGVTAYVTTDIGSAPFLWVAPLCLYLLSFIVAFQSRPSIRPHVALVAQALSLVAAAALIHARVGSLLLAGFLQFTAFFFTALVCHQALVARRPATGRLTEFYLCLSAGGVVGGAFNAFLAPVLFHSVVEYPAVLALAVLARPWGRGRWPFWVTAALLVCAAGGLAAVQLAHPLPHLWRPRRIDIALASAFVVAAAVAALVTQARAVAFFLAVCLVLIASDRVSDRVNVTGAWRDFFGVLRQSRMQVPGLGGEVRMLAHGTTLHGAQATASAFRCRPLVYYAPPTPIGQVIEAVQAAHPAAQFGAVGLGTGAVAAYTRPTDALTFFEIDPLVVRVATDPAHFTYVNGCARAAPRIVLGDARLTLARTASGALDMLLIDAFASDTVPAHLLTVEAVRMYLARLKPDGVLVLHLSNRNLDLIAPAIAAGRAAGGVVLVQRHKAAKGPLLSEADEDAVIVGRSGAALAPFSADPRWRQPDRSSVRAWTDDYTDIFGALVRRTAERWKRSDPG